jgi:TonB family protein
VGLVLVLGCASKPRSAPVTIPLPKPPRPVAELVAQLAAQDAPTRASAAWALAGADEVDSGVIQALVTALADPSEPVREGATWALAHVNGGALRNEQEWDSPPKILVQPRPQYPDYAFHKKIEGTVMVVILINSLGKVAHAEIRESIPHLDEAALACVRDWLFEPAQRGGKPVATVAVAPVMFRIY